MRCEIVGVFGSEVEDESGKVRHVRQLRGESKSRAAGLWRKKPGHWASFFLFNGALS